MKTPRWYYIPTNTHISIALYCQNRQSILHWHSSVNLPIVFIDTYNNMGIKDVLILFINSKWDILYIEGWLQTNIEGYNHHIHTIWCQLCYIICHIIHYFVVRDGSRIHHGNWPTENRFRQEEIPSLFRHHQLNTNTHHPTS